MASLTPEQSAKLVHVAKKVTSVAGDFTIHGQLAAFEYFNWIPDVATATLALNGVDRAVSRPAGKRSRWLGDTVGTNYAGTTAQVSFYPSKIGNAVPGSPIRIVNLDATNPITGNFPTTVFNISGNIGSFIAWYTDNAPAFQTKVYSKSGHPYFGTQAATPVGP